MWQWLQANSGAVGAIASILMLLVWIAYLQLFFTSLRRARRAVIHISAVAGDGDGLRCLVTNMGADMVYVLGVRVDLSVDNTVCRSLMTDRVDDEGPFGGDLRSRTHQGPMTGGAALDIGSFDRICRRAMRDHGLAADVEACDWLEITVLVAAQQAHRLMGGHKRYAISHENGVLRVRPDQVLTRQITSRRKQTELLEALRV